MAEQLECPKCKEAQVIYKEGNGSKKWFCISCNEYFTDEEINKGYSKYANK